MEHCLVKTRLELKLICGDAQKLYKMYERMVWFKYSSEKVFTEMFWDAFGNAYVKRGV